MRGVPRRRRAALFRRCCLPGAVSATALDGLGQPDRESAADDEGGGREQLQIFVEVAGCEPDLHLLVHPEQGEADRHQALAKAQALVFPIQWDEPFGLVMIEAMGSGTPVVALRRGSVSELVADGVTGFVRDEPDELADALLRSIGSIQPTAVVTWSRISAPNAWSRATSARSSTLSGSAVPVMNRSSLSHRSSPQRKSCWQQRATVKRRRSATSDR